MFNMKRIFLLVAFSLLLAFAATAQTVKFSATEFAYKFYNEHTRKWSDWSEWEYCGRMLVVMNFDRERITVYSKETQEYDIVKYYDKTTDDSGGEIVPMLCVNENGLRCNIRLRIQKNGARQLYVDFNDALFVYQLEDR